MDLYYRRYTIKIITIIIIIIKIIIITHLGITGRLG